MTEGKVPRELPEGFVWITAKYSSGRCNICGKPVLAGQRVAFHPRRKTKMHHKCFEDPKSVVRDVHIRIVPGGAPGLPGRRNRGW